MKTKNIKTALLIISVLLMLPLASLAQGDMGPGPRGRNQEKMEAQRIAYITKKLNLTPAEAEKFWPVYNQHHDQMKKRMEDFRKNMDVEPEDIASMSDDEAAQALDVHLQNEKEMYQSRQEFLLSLKEVIPVRKILLLLDAEKGFRMEMMRSAARRGPGGRK